jgi:hypothetical protein
MLDESIRGAIGAICRHLSNIPAQAVDIPENYGMTEDARFGGGS